MKENMYSKDEKSGMTRAWCTSLCFGYSELLHVTYKINCIFINEIRENSTCILVSFFNFQLWMNSCINATMNLRLISCASANNQKLNWVHRDKKKFIYLYNLSSTINFTRVIQEVLSLTKKVWHNQDSFSLFFNIASPPPPLEHQYTWSSDVHAL